MEKDHLLLTSRNGQAADPCSDENAGRQDDDTLRSDGTRGCSALDNDGVYGVYSSSQGLRKQPRMTHQQVPCSWQDSEEKIQAKIVSSTAPITKNFGITT